MTPMRPASIFVGIPAGILVGYVGLYILFWGGIAGFVDGVGADPVSASKIAWSIVKIIFSVPISYFSSVFLLIGIGALLHDYSEKC